MRYLCLHMPWLSTDRLRRRLDTPPDAPAPLATVAKIKSAHRLVAVDRRAGALGLKPGTALADARAMHPDLAIHDADPDGDRDTRDAIVDWCRLFTPLAAPDGDDGVVLDVTGAAHLFGGEVALMDTIVARLARQGFTAVVAIAATPGAAWALTRHGRRLEPEGQDRRIGPEGQDRRLVPEGTGAAALAKLFAPMPLAALRLDAPTIARLGQAGLRRIGDLMLRPRAPIVARFGIAIHHRLDVLLDRARDPISPRFEAPAFVAERRFAEGIARREDIEATILALAHDLCGLLARHGEGARTLDVSLFRVDGIVKHIGAGTSRPLRDPLAMARLFRERIEAAGEDGLDTGYGFDVIRLAALSAERLDQTQASWMEASWMEAGWMEASWAEAGADGSEIADLVDRLGARFGLGRITRLATADTHRPERTDVAAAAASVPAMRRAGRMAVARTEAIEIDETLPARPIRLLEHPEPIDAIASVPDGPPLRFRWRRVMHDVAAIEGPERIGPDWWKQGQGGNGNATRTRDYFRAEDTDGQRFWLYREGLYHEAPEPRWFLHGFFA